MPVLLVLIYIFSAMYSFHQVHKSFYYNNKHLSKNYIEWDELKNNFNYISYKSAVEKYDIKKLKKKNKIIFVNYKFQGLKKTLIKIILRFFNIIFLKSYSFLAVYDDFLSLVFDLFVFT